MKRKKNKKTQHQIFSGIRKQTAPPTKQFSNRKRNDKADASRRFTKHKKSDDISKEL